MVNIMAMAHLYKDGYYEEKGIFSENKYLYYTGEFINNQFNGKGKLYMDTV